MDNNKLLDVCTFSSSRNFRYARTESVRLRDGATSLRPAVTILAVGLKSISIMTR